MVTPLAWKRRFYGLSEPSACERATLPRFLAGMVFQGIWWAGYILVPFVLAKSLAAPGGLITLAVMMDTSSMLLALYWGHLLDGGRRRSLIFWGGLLGRLCLVASLLIRSASQFVLLLAVAYFFSGIVYPAQSGILQANFRPRLQGRIWGWGTCIQNLVAVATSLIVGRILDHDPGRFGAVYAVIGGCGFVYLWILSRLPAAAAVPGPDRDGAAGRLPAERLAQISPPAAGIRPSPVRAGANRSWLPPPLPTWGPLRSGRLLRAIGQPFAAALATYRQDRGYLWYEGNFMTYGLAYLMLQPLLPILFRDRFDLDYQQISTARVLIAQVGVALLGPAMGRVMDSYHPARLCRLAFGLMALFPVGLILADRLTIAQPVQLIYFSFVLYSLGMAGVNIGWNVGSLAFAPPRQGSHYQGIHVAMVGLRGLLGPAIGFTIYKLLGMDSVFVLATGLFLAASGSSGLLWRWLDQRGH